jgi:cytochrome c-type biogenesis protein CcmE
MIRRLVATVLLTTSLGGAMTVLLPAASAHADLLCVGSTSKQDSKNSAGAVCVGGAVELHP